jgi:hypothetical protein
MTTIGILFYAAAFFSLIMTLIGLVYLAKWMHFASYHQGGANGYADGYLEGYNAALRGFQPFIESELKLRYKMLIRSRESD